MHFIVCTRLISSVFDLSTTKWITQLNNFAFSIIKIKKKKKKFNYVLIKLNIPNIKPFFDEN